MNTTTDNVLHFIRTQAAKQEYPTLREIMAAEGIASTSVVLYHVRKLAAAGLITYTPGLHRSIRITGEIK